MGKEFIFKIIGKKFCIFISAYYFYIMIAVQLSKKLLQMKGYQTFWKQGKRQGTYITKSLTDFHKKIHLSLKTDFARTIETDSAVDWPFGLYAEVIATTDKANPKNNKAFKIAE